MPPHFSSLSQQGQVRRMTALARIALAAYPIQPAELRLLNHLWNTTFRVVASDGSPFMLRVHHPGTTSAAAVRSELLWLAALRREADLPVPEPVQTREEDFVTVASHPGVPQPRLCVLFRWIEGEFLFEGLTPAHLTHVGRLMARLHHHSAGWMPPAGFTRHRVDKLNPMLRDRDDHFDEAVAASAVRTVSALCSPEEAAVVATAIEKVWALLRALGEDAAHFGLIHADLHHRNFLFHDDGAGAIDFDDCGYGHWLYDLAVPISQLHFHPNGAALRQGLLAGYRQDRSLTEEDERHLESFLALRALQDLLGVIEEREHPAFRDEWQGWVANELRGLRAFVDR